VARGFVDAVAWGEHLRVWEILGPEGKATVLKVAAARGMEPALAARLTDGTAAVPERDEFLADLVNGLRADLAGCDLDVLQYAVDPQIAGPGRVRVLLTAPLPAIGAEVALPVGWIELVQHGGKWQVERLSPRTTTVT
jgi:hypothetical protein